MTLYHNNTHFCFLLLGDGASPLIPLLLRPLGLRQEAGPGGQQPAGDAEEALPPGQAVRGASEVRVSDNNLTNLCKFTEK